MSLQITVRGTAEEIYPAERAIVSLAVAIEGDNKDDVAKEAAKVQEPLIEQLEQLEDRNAVARWDAGQIRVYSHRPYEPDGKRGPLVHAARLDVSAEFVDFERLSGFVDYWAGRDGVQINHVEWDLTAKNRRALEADVRRAAVDDAVHKAQGYANAVRRGRVVAVEFADPGMLADSGFDGGGPAPKMARMMTEAATAGPSIALVSEDITISVEVDARFTTEG